jgi:26S proteasome regulatory subunit N1
MLLLWDIDDGFGGQIEKYMEHTNNDIQAGAFMAYGLINTGITNEMDPVSAVLVEKLVCNEDKLKIGALMGLSFTYAGSTREDLLEEISPIILDSDNSTELKAVAALTLGLIYVGTCNEEVAQAILQTLMEMEEKEIDNPFSRLFCLGLGLLFLG